MLVLKNGTKRFGELRREVQGVSERMLTQTLQQLEENKMLLRKSFNTVPPTLNIPSRHLAKRRVKLKNSWIGYNLILEIFWLIK